MTEEQALQYAKYAADKTFEVLGTQSAVRFTLTDKAASVFESKIGGMPYFPPGAEIPVDSYGDQLRFLMQIRCSDVRGIDIFPEQGMLQFWIHADDCWGMQDRNGLGFRVIYYDTVSEETIVPPVSAFTDMDREFYPVHGAFGVAFQAAEADTPRTLLKYQDAFCKYFHEISGVQIESPYALRYQLHLPESVFEEALHRGYFPGGHKIGGSSAFCQYDPRQTEAQQTQYDFQLLQLRSDFGRINGQNYNNIMWGDGGICHFFISSEKLKKRDFSDVFYYCDCC